MPLKDLEARKKYHKTYMAKWYKKNSKKHQRYVSKNSKKYREENRKIILEFKKDGCFLCSEKEPCCMSAHHLRDKDFTIGEAQRRKLSPDRVRKELKKCICLCENCHRKVHAGILKLDAGDPVISQVS